MLGGRGTKKASFRRQTCGPTSENRESDLATMCQSGAIVRHISQSLLDGDNFDVIYIFSSIFRNFFLLLAWVNEFPEFSLTQEKYFQIPDLFPFSWLSGNPV